MSNKTIMNINGTTLGMIPGLKEEYINGLLECSKQIGADLNIEVKDITIVDAGEMPASTITSKTYTTVENGKHTTTIYLNNEFYGVAYGFGPLQVFGIATVLRKTWRNRNRVLVGLKPIETVDYTYDNWNNQEDIIDAYAYGFLTLEAYFEYEVAEMAFGVLTQDMSDDMAESILEYMDLIADEEEG